MLLRCFTLLSGSLALTIASAAAITSASNPQPFLAVHGGIYSIDSLWIGETLNDAKARLDSLRDQPKINVKLDPGECVLGTQQDWLTAHDPRPNSKCATAIELTGKNYDLTVSFVEDYPNNPGQMCVSSIKYVPHGFAVTPGTAQSDYSAANVFRALTQASLSQVPQFYDDSGLDPAYLQLYFSQATTCYRENNCFTGYDRCMQAAQCAQVVAARDSVQSTQPTTYIQIIAQPYVTQQGAYAFRARYEGLPGWPSILGASPSPRPAPCSTDAILAAPQITYNIGSVTTKNKETVPSALVSNGKILACHGLVCLLAFPLSADGYEVAGFFHASGGWREIWRVRAPKNYSPKGDEQVVTDLQSVLEFKTYNEGWINVPAPATPKPTLKPKSQKLSPANVPH